MGVNELRRVRQLKDENRRLKQVVADLTLDKQMLQEVLQKGLRPARQRSIAHELTARIARQSRQMFRAPRPERPVVTEINTWERCRTNV